MDRTSFEKALKDGIRFFRVIDDDCGNEYVCRGEIVKFYKDDYSPCPGFYYPNKEDREETGKSGTWGYICLSALEPLTLKEQREVLEQNSDTECQVSPIKSQHTDTNSHYCIDGIQPIQYCQRCLTPEQFQGACIKDVIKYLSRFGKKDEKIREAEKALDYALWLYMSVAGKDVDPTKHNHEAIFKALEID